MLCGIIKRIRRFSRHRKDKEMFIDDETFTEEVKSTLYRCDLFMERVGSNEVIIDKEGLDEFMFLYKTFFKGLRVKNKNIRKLNVRGYRIQEIENILVLSNKLNLIIKSF